ncbi:MAG TPA: aminotransferase class V-fold PLP-dependent enzyme [Jatrophihabitans sp.]|nr:aminotransferase class V-fold PLP-dependent enzyme [Jatrophihabitans sp.]
MASGWFDAASGLPWHPVAREALLAALQDGWADPAKLAGPGRRSATLLEAARETVAEQLLVQPDEVIFTPTGSHALQLAVLGTLAGRARVGAAVVHSAVEHSVVLKAVAWHDGPSVAVPVDGHARVDPEAFSAACAGDGVAAAVLQAANHEIGSLQPEVDSQGVPLVVDAAHSILYGAPPEQAAVFTADARLWGGPDVGVLVVRRGIRWRPPFPVDESERGRGLGVPSVPAVLAAAASLRAFRAADEAGRLSGHIERLRDRIPATVPDTEVLGDPVQRLPHILTFSSLYVDGEALLTELDRHGFSVSSGSSCTSDTLTPSHVLVAMGALTSGNVRISLHPQVERADIDRFLAVLPGALAAVRAQLPDTARPETRTVDSRGRRCPLPILDLAAALPGIGVGEQLTVLADDPAAAGDIAAWCRMSGQLLVQSGMESFTVQRVR